MELHTYYSKIGLLRVSWGGSISVESICRHFELLKANTFYARNLRIISSTDIEELAFPLTKENMLAVRQWRVEALMDYESVKTAIYNLNPVPSAYLSYFSEFFDSEKSCIRQFDTEEAACAWLLGSELRSNIGNQSLEGG